MRLRARRAQNPSPGGAQAGRIALLTASGIHLGFQATITAVTYPELFGGPRATLPERQFEHVKQIAPLAGAVYAVLAGAAGWAAISALRSPGDRALTATFISCAAAAAAPITTGSVTVPLHIGVAKGLTSPARLEAILAADRFRTGFAAIGLIAAAQALGE